MQPWLASGVLRYAIVLSCGWVSLAGIIAVTCDSIAAEPPSSESRLIPVRTIRLDEIDPCTNDPIVIDGKLMVIASPSVEGGVIRMDGMATLLGSTQTGLSAHHLSVQQRFNLNWKMSVGLLEPVNLRLPIVDRPFLPVTILAAKLQAMWDGSAALLAITDLSLDCA